MCECFTMVHVGCTDKWKSVIMEVDIHWKLTKLNFVMLSVTIRDKKIKLLSLPCRNYN